MGNQTLQVAKMFVKAIFNKVGLEIISIKKSPKHNLLGLRRFSIRSIIDVGANSGQFARTIISSFPESNIYCIEPLSQVFHQLSDWANMQNGRVKTFNFALGDFQGISEMMFHVDHSYSSSLLRTTDYGASIFPQMQHQSPVPVKVTTLDSFVESLPGTLDEEILIKLDVQGYEDRVIRGGTKTFRDARACILEINLDYLYENQGGFMDLANSLQDLGYYYVGNLDQTFGEDGHVIFIDSVFIKR